MEKQSIKHNGDENWNQLISTELSLLEAAPLGISINMEGKTIFVNKAYLKMFGYDSPHELIGTSPTEQVAPCCREEVKEKIFRRARGEKLEKSHETLGQRRDGSIINLLVQVDLMQLEGGPANLAFFTDITESKKAEKKLHHQLEGQSLLLEISRQFSNIADLELDRTLNLVLDEIGRFTESDHSFIGLLQGDDMSISQAYGWYAEGMKPRSAEGGRLLPGELSWMMSRLLSFQNIHISAIDELPEEALAEKKFLLDREIKSMLTVPLFSENKLMGFIGFDSRGKEREWPYESQVLLESAAQIISQGMQRKKVAEALEASENYYRTIFENTGAATLIIEEDETISNANREWEKYGYVKEELLGNKFSDMIIENHAETVATYHESRRDKPDIVPTRYRSGIVNKAGEEKECLIIADIIPETARSVVAVIDTSEYNRINRELKAISAINMAMLDAESEDALLLEACRNIVEIGEYRFAWIGYGDSNTSGYVIPKAHAGFEAGYLDKICSELGKTDSGIRPMSTTIDTGQIFICRNIEGEFRSEVCRTEAMSRGYRSMIAVPLKLEGKNPIGALGIYSEEKEIFDEEEVGLLKEMAQNLTYGIISLRTRAENTRSAQELKLSLERMGQLLNQTVASLEAVIKIRDPYTAEHQRRVTKLASAIAEEMSLAEDQKKAIFIAASLHDIGKMNIPTEILSRPGKITELEFSIIKLHSQSGYEVIKNINFPWSIDEIILQHHERIDGSGYPQGLKGEEIHLAASIIGVADVVEAMSSHRPYRPALGLVKALEEISLQRGVKYDAKVVDACLNVFNNRGFIF